MQRGEISSYRFSYRTVGTGVAMGVGVYMAAVPGAIAGGSFWAAEQVYNGLNYCWNQTFNFCQDLQNALKTGRYPGR